MQGVCRLVEALNLPNKVEKQGIVVAEGAQSRRIKYLEVFEILSRGVRARVLLRLKFASEISRGSAPLKVIKGRWSEVTLQKPRFVRGTLVPFVEVFKEGMSG
jgi:hypothetical protein